MSRDDRARGDNPAERVPVPLPGQRCPRCRRTAPRADGIPCSLCAPGDTSPEAAAERHADAMAEVRSAADDLWDRIHRAADEEP